jgi:hypothetical protein
VPTPTTETPGVALAGTGWYGPTDAEVISLYNIEVVDEVVNGNGEDPSGLQEVRRDQ